LIFTTVGTHDAPFDRLVRRMDALAGETEEPVWIQVGHATVTPGRAPYRRFFLPEEYRRLFEESRTIVSHAGIGTLLEAARRRKPLVCVPRLRRFGEHWDDHQLEICRELARSGTLHFVDDPNDLDLTVLSRAEPPEFPGSGNGLGERVAGFLRETAMRETFNGSHP
jgi:UDP-N-acetylglucosamine transferase subunit ALG13